jgi:regulator of protease activity HflC (stomatin/prohibitin superfamily)
MVEVKQVDLPEQMIRIPEQMIRIIARQAEAERERRARVIHADGVYLAAEKLAVAADARRNSTDKDLGNASMNRR